MRHRALLLGVLLPAAFSHAFYDALIGGDDRDRRERRFEYVGFSYDVRAPRPPHAPHPPHAPEPPRMRPMRAGFCEVRQVHVLTAPASATGRLAVEIGGGELDMDAVEGLDQVEVEATLCAPSTEQLERLGVTLGPDADLLRLNTIEPLNGDGYGRVDLRVRVPLGMAATISERESALRGGPRGRLRRGS